MKGGAKVVVEKHRHEGVFVARGKRRVGDEEHGPGRFGIRRKTNFRGRSGRRAKNRIQSVEPVSLEEVAAGILGGLDNVHIKPGTKLLYLGGASGTTVSHCSDIVGPNGLVYGGESFLIVLGEI